MTEIKGGDIDCSYVKEPRRMADIILDITSNDRFAALDSKTKAQISACIDDRFPRSKTQKREDNRYLREVYRHLYRCGPLPYG